MRLSTVFTIARKELREALRDRRTIFMMVGLPILIYPLAILGMSKLQESQQEAQTAKTSRVAIWGEIPPEIVNRMSADKKVEALPWHRVPQSVRQGLEDGTYSTPAPPPFSLDAGVRPRPRPLPDTEWAKAAQKVLLDRDADAIVIPWPGFTQKLADGEAGAVTILFDTVRPDSGEARDRVSDALRLHREELLKQRERSGSLKTGFTKGMEIWSQNVSPEKRTSANVLGMMLPYALITFSVMSGFYAAIDMTAGEKERGTMQTLLCAPLHSIEIISGKYLAVFTIALIATVVNLASLSMTFSRVKLLPGMQLTMSPESGLLAFLLLIPIVMTVTALYLAIGAFARDFKDGQNYLTPVLMGLILPLMVTMAPGVELNAHLAFVPIVNIALLIKTVFLNEWRADMIFLVLTSSFCYASLALMFAATVFERNNLLLGGKESAGSLLDFSRRRGARPTPAVSVFVFAVCLVLAFYGTVFLERQKMPITIGVIQYGFFLLPAVGLAWAKGYDFREALSFRPIPARGLLGAVLIGLSGWTFAAGVLVRLLPPPESLVRALEKVLLMDGRDASLGLTLFLVALTPAVCEETLFRGMILGGFRRMGMWPAIILSGFLFGIAHSSIYRLLPTFFLGVVFGLAVWKTGSIYAGMICHALNNGLMVMVARYRPLSESLRAKDSVYLPWEYVGIGCVALAAGIWLVMTSRDGEASGSPSSPAVVS